MKVHYISKIIQYNFYKTFSKDSFNEELNNELLRIHVNNVEFSDFNMTLYISPR